MNKQRQDAWTKDDDMLLTESVLRHIRNGKTQTEAFKQVATMLSRTPAACGFRWNATIRQQHGEAIHLAKSIRKQAKKKEVITLDETEHEMIGSVIDVLEKLKTTSVYATDEMDVTKREQIQQLQQENYKLKTELKRYHEAWNEMNQLWEWIKNSNEH